MISLFSWMRQKISTPSGVRDLITGSAALGASFATIVQVWVSVNDEPMLPQLNATSIVELRNGVQERRDALYAEIESLDALLIDISRAEAALTGEVLVAQKTVGGLDSWWLAALKTLAVYFILSFSFVCAGIAIVFDLIGLLLGYKFVLVGAIWDWSWSKMTIEWYWEKAPAIGVLAGIAILVLLGVASNFMESARKGKNRVGI